MKRRSPPRRVLVIAGPGDDHAVAVALALAGRGLEPVRVDLARLPAHGFSAWAGGGRPVAVSLGAEAGPVDPSTCLAAWWRRPRDPSPPSRLGAATRRLFTGEWSAALRGLRHVVPGRWVNDPGREEVARLKLLQLEVARREGLDVPRTLVTSDLDEARRFATGCRDGAVLKSLSPTRETGWTRAVTARSQWLATRLATGPAILQERLPGLDLRVTVVGGRLFALAADAGAGGSPDDVRVDWWRAAAAGGPVVLPPGLSRRLLALVGRLGLVYGAIDLRRRRNGRWAFLEVNPSGQWLHAEVAGGQPITAAVVDLLAGVRGGAVPPPARRPASRGGRGSPAAPTRAGRPSARRRP